MTVAEYPTNHPVENIECRYKCTLQYNWEEAPLYERVGRLCGGWYGNPLGHGGSQAGGGGGDLHFLFSEISAGQPRSRHIPAVIMGPEAICLAINGWSSDANQFYAFAFCRTKWDGCKENVRSLLKTITPVSTCKSLCGDVRTRVTSVPLWQLTVCHRCELQHKSRRYSFHYFQGFGFFVLHFLWNSAIRAEQSFF